MAYAFSGFVLQVPLLIVMIAGFVLVSSRKARLGGRSTMFALIGLSLLTLELVMSGIWNIMFPRLVAELDLQVSSFGMISLAVGLVLTLLTAVGIGLLIAALVSRPAADPAFPEPPPGH